ncbi:MULTISPECIES: hypothetical protein [Rhodococcus]|nr:MULTISPECIES: hypothetical protein [Rhodococcus]MBQ9052710.1 hypothetical protein [Rhodococcus sp. (in: high G+C Gram-positive bacteria)]
MNRCELAPGDVPASQDRPQSQPGEATGVRAFRQIAAGSVRYEGSGRTRRHESAMPERGQSRVDAGIIAVVAVITGVFVALTGHGLVAALATVVGLALGMAIVRYLIKGR